jgi:hypothetical protein
MVTLVVELQVVVALVVFWSFRPRTESGHEANTGRGPMLVKIRVR